MCMEDADLLSERIADKIRSNSYSDGSPVSTTADIAEELDVTPQTIRNHINQALAYPGIKHREIRGAPVYWYEEDTAFEDKTPQFGGLLDENDFYPLAWERRGHWQGLRQHIRADVGNDVPANRRAKYLWEVFGNHSAMRAGLSIRLNKLTDTSGPTSRSDVPEEFYEMGEPTVSAKTMKYYFEERPLLEVEAYGDVVGFWEFEDYEHSLKTEFRNEVGAVDLETIDNAKINQWVPTCEEILDVGDAWDGLLSDLYNWKW